MEFTYSLYIVAAIALAAFIARRTDRKVLAFALSFWVLAQPVMHYAFVLHLPGFDLTLNRILLFFTLGYYILAPASGLRAAATQAASKSHVPFEKYLYIYFAIVLVSLAANLGNIKLSNIYVVPLEIITFILVYLTVRRFSTHKLIDAMIASIIVMAVSGAAIAFFQYAVDSDFLRTREAWTAFGKVKRATGTFPYEYHFGAFQVLGVMATLIRFRGSFLVYILVPILATSVILTFHRLDMLIMAVCLLTYFFFFTNTKYKTIVTVLSVVALIVAYAIYPLVEKIGKESDIVATLEGRIGQDTITGRLLQNQVLAREIFTDPTLMGVGGYENPAYDTIMGKHGLINLTEDGRTAVAFRAHNGYLEVGILRGALAMIVFTLLFISMLRYFMKRSTRVSRYSVLPVYAVIIFMLSNIGNSLSSFSFYMPLLCAMLAGAFVNYHRLDLGLRATENTATSSKNRGIRG